MHQTRACEMLKQRFLRSYLNNCEVEIIKDVSDKRDSKKIFLVEGGINSAW